MTIADSLDATRLRTVDIDGLATRCYDAGSGASAVLVHGGNFGSIYSLDGFSLNFDALSAGFRVVAFDKLGQGFTDAPSEDADFTFDAVLEHLAKVVERFAPAGAHLLGHSRGGLVAAALAQGRPELVRSLTIVDSGTLAPEDPAYPAGEFYARLPRIGDAPAFDEVAVEPVAQAFRTEQITEDFHRRLYEIASRPETRRVRKRMRGRAGEVFRASVAAARGRVAERMRGEGFPVPTQVIWGQNDRSIPSRRGFELYQIIAAKTRVAELTILNRSGHYVFREQPEAFDGAVTAFWSRAAGE